MKSEANWGTGHFRDPIPTECHINCPEDGGSVWSPSSCAATLSPLIRRTATPEGAVDAEDRGDDDRSRVEDVAEDDGEEVGKGVVAKDDDIIKDEGEGEGEGCLLLAEHVFRSRPRPVALGDGGGEEEEQEGEDKVGIGGERE